MKINEQAMTGTRSQGLGYDSQGAAGRMQKGELTLPKTTIKRAEPARLKPGGNATLARPHLIYQENWIFMQNVLSFKY